MIRKGILFFLAVSFIIIISGCETLKGAGKGAAEGFKKDWVEAQKIDDWLRKNLW